MFGKFRAIYPGGFIDILKNEYSWSPGMRAAQSLCLDRNSITRLVQLEDLQRNGRIIHQRVKKRLAAMHLC